MKLIISGGHFTPGEAVIEELKGTCELLVVGREHSFEGDSGYSYEYMVCQKMGIPFATISTARLQRILTPYILSSILKFPKGMIQSFSLLRTFKPDIVLVFGGYVALPLSAAAFVLGIPVVVHEQTQRAGLTNRLIGRFARKVCISFSSSKPYFAAEKIVVTGNPLRKKIFTQETSFDIPKGFPVVYITGGGGGSHFINTLTFKTLPRLVKEYVLIHQTGDSHTYNDFARALHARDALPLAFRARYIVKKYIMPDEIGWVLHSASLVVSRAGINTVCELITLSKACLLLPLPHGQLGEQLENAQLAQRVGIGEYIEQRALSEEKFYEKIHYLVTHRDTFEKKNILSARARFVDAAERIVSVLDSVYEEGKQKKN